jgi:hypothetical protein
VCPALCGGGAISDVRMLVMEVGGSMKERP